LWVKRFTASLKTKPAAKRSPSGILFGRLLIGINVSAGLLILADGVHLDQSHPAQGAKDHVRLLEKVESLKAIAATAGAAAIAAGMTLGDSRDWQQARKELYAAEESLALSEDSAAAYKARIDDLNDQLHDARLTLRDAAKAITEAQHDEACKAEALAAQAFLKAGDDFYAAHCALAETIDVRIKLKNKILGLPEWMGGGYPVEVLLMPPEGSTFTRDQLMRRPPRALKGVA
jgi:hypothetical protein